MRENPYEAPEMPADSPPPILAWTDEAKAYALVGVMLLIAAALWILDPDVGRYR